MDIDFIKQLTQVVIQIGVLPVIVFALLYKDFKFSQKIVEIESREMDTQEEIKTALQNMRETNSLLARIITNGKSDANR